MSMKDAYIKKLDAQLREWSAEIDKLKAKADKATAEAQIKHHKQIQELRSMQAQAREKMEEIKKARGDAWEDLKDGAEKAWGTLGTALKSAASRFK